jgi:hypothetical protein
VGLRDADHFHFCDQLELLHGLHEQGGMRPKQTRPTRPYRELLDEAASHRALRALVTAFFVRSLASARSLGDGGALLGADDVAALDPHLELLEALAAAPPATRAAS